MRVVVRHVDELRAAVVRRGRDRPRELLLSYLGGHVDNLAALHVRPEIHDQARELLDPFVHRQAIVTGARMTFT